MKHPDYPLLWWIKEKSVAAPSWRPSCMLTERGPLVYIIWATGTDRFKIGITSGLLRSRLRSLQTGSCTPLVPIAAIPSTTREVALDLESSIHDEFKDQRVCGEFFALSDADIKVIALMQAFNDPDVMRWAIEQARAWDGQP